MFVVRFIMLTNKLPKKDAGGESFQPKLYHYVVAKVAKEMGVRAKDKNSLIVTGQMINFLAGTILLICVWIFIQRLSIGNQNIKLLTFAFVAFNPTLLGINGQATNDTFVILFSTLAIYSAYFFLKRESWVGFVAAIFFSTLAIVSKTNGWVTIIAIFLAILAKSVSEKMILKYGFFAVSFLFAVATLAFYYPVTQYQYNYKKFGTPFLINMEKAPAPNMFTKTDIPKPGILSIQDGFFTFRFIELLKNPYIDNFVGLRHPHRSSFWTMLYARAHTIRFNNWPPSWSGHSNLIFVNTRLILIFALIPTLIILMGAVLEGRNLIIGYFSRMYEKIIYTNSDSLTYLSSRYSR